MVINPRTLTPSTCDAAAASASASPGGTPRLVGSPDTFTWMRQLRILPALTARLPSSAASSRRSSECTQSKSPGTYRALLVCSVPTRCRVTPGGSWGSFSRASCTRFSPTCATPSSTAASTRDKGTPLVTAINVTSSGFRPARSKARPSRSLTASSRSFSSRSTSMPPRRSSDRIRQGHHRSFTPAGGRSSPPGQPARIQHHPGALGHPVQDRPAPVAAQDPHRPEQDLIAQHHVDALAALRLHDGRRRHHHPLLPPGGEDHVHLAAVDQAGVKAVQPDPPPEFVSRGAAFHQRSRKLALRDSP